MNVRHRTLWQNTSPFLVIEESQNYYIAAQIPYTSLSHEHLQLLQKTFYEPIPTEQWRDVTWRVEVKEQAFDKSNMVTEAGVFDGARRLAHLVCGGDYRLRKVIVEWFHGVPLDDAQEGWAFIIERKEPHD